jgi:predicted nucleic acid-binding Zn ribbon protein
LLGEAVEALLTDQGWSTANAVAGLMAGWPQVVGADLADHVVPDSFTDGQLILRADSTAWATQVRLLLPQLRTAIDREVGRGVVADISVVGRWTEAGRGPGAARHVRLALSITSGPRQSPKGAGGYCNTAFGQTNRS